jgi:hypothetical protein
MFTELVVQVVGQLGTSGRSRCWLVRLVGWSGAPVRRCRDGDAVTGRQAWEGRRLAGWDGGMHLVAGAAAGLDPRLGRDASAPSGAGREMCDRPQALAAAVRSTTRPWAAHVGASGRQCARVAGPGAGGAAHGGLRADVHQRCRAARQRPGNRAAPAGRPVQTGHASKKSPASKNSRWWSSLPGMAGMAGSGGGSPPQHAWLFQGQPVEQAQQSSAGAVIVGAPGGRLAGSGAAAAQILMRTHDSALRAGQRTLAVGEALR